MDSAEHVRRNSCCFSAPDDDSSTEENPFSISAIMMPNPSPSPQDGAGDRAMPAGAGTPAKPAAKRVGPAGLDADERPSQAKPAAEHRVDDRGVSPKRPAKASSMAVKPSSGCLSKHTAAMLKAWLKERFLAKNIQSEIVRCWLPECPFAVAPGCGNIADFTLAVRAALLDLDSGQMVFLLKVPKNDVQGWSVRLLEL